ncbi:hypothetical protein BDY24DRAFT_399671 [Mrakia frigida]|uniref:uncharacterized protein n=1 Tax=Mrakia frigida TaxID=29902 RepID=UPI003FCBF010
MGKPTPSSHSSTLSSKLLLMIHDASETLLNREEADRISSELANNVRGSSSSRKRKRVEGGLGGGLLAELSEDLDVEDERAKALVSALVRHIRLKRRPPPPNPSLLARPSSSRPRSLLPQPRSGSSSYPPTTAAELVTRLGGPFHPSRRTRPHFSTHSPTYEFAVPSFSPSPPPPPSTSNTVLDSAPPLASTSTSNAVASSSSSDTIQPLGPPLASSSSSSSSNHPNLPEDAQPPLSPPWQPAHELHISPERLESYRAFRQEHYLRSQPQQHPPPPQDVNRIYTLTPNAYYARGHAGREDDDPSSGRWLSGVEFPILDARALGLASASSRGVHYGGGEESESEFDEEDEEERRYGSRVRAGPVGGRLGSRQVEREEWEWDWEEQMEEEEERLRARQERRRRVPQISISLSPPPPAAGGSGSGSGLGDAW